MTDLYRLDSVQIGATDVDDASAAYALLLGVAPTRSPSGAQRFQLERGAVEVEQGDPGVHSIRFVGESARTTWPHEGEAFHGLRVLLSAASPTPPPLTVAVDGVAAIDHVVIRTPAPDRAIVLWRDRLGLRLALDRIFPERGLRLLFFRSGGITLEFASGHPAPAPPAVPEEPDVFYGVSYRVPSLEACRERLGRAGLDVSTVRPGMRRGTSVLTVRSGTAGVPTLLLQEHERAPT